VFKPEPYTFDRIIRLLFHVGIISFAIWLANFLSGAIIPLFAGILLAYLLNPMVNWVQAKSVPNRTLAVISTLSGISLALTLVVLIITPMITLEVQNMERIVHEFSQNSDWKARATKIVPEEMWETIKIYATEDQVNELTKADNLIKLSGKVVERVLPQTLSLIKGTTHFILGLIGLGIVFIYLFFLLIDFEALRRVWHAYLPAPYRPKIIQVVTDFDRAMSHYFRAQALVSSIMGLLFMLGFSLIGLPLGLLLGLLFGLLSMVPYLQLLGLIPAFILAVFAALDSGSSFATMLILTSAVFIIIQLIQDMLLTPKIMGRALGMPAALIIFSLSVWGQLLGFIGLIIALPLTQLLLSYYKQYVASTETSLEPTPTAANEP